MTADQGAVCMVSELDVRMAFRLILGREIEDDSTIRMFIANCPTIAELRAAFLDCDEFRSLYAGRVAPVPAASHGHPLEIGIPRIDTRATPDQFAAMLARVEATWRTLGGSEPWWSVLTDDGFRADRFDQQARDAFYASGQGDVAIFEGALRRAGIDPVTLDTCFELGCGVGRLTGWLARIFPRVIAADISSNHIELARRHLEQAGQANVQLLHVQDHAAYDQLPPIDAFFSVIVLQHNPPPVMRFILERLLGRLRLGGIGHFQVPTNIAGYGFDSGNPNPLPEGEMEMHAFPQADLFDMIADTGCRVIEFREDHVTGPGILSNRLLVQKVA